MDDSDARRSTLDVYRYHFERPYLDSTTKFYQAESKQFLAENSIVDYMKKVGRTPCRPPPSPSPHPFMITKPIEHLKITLPRLKLDWTKREIELDSIYIPTS